MENKEHVVICDLDGTLCLFEKEDKSKSNYRNPYDASTCGNDLVNEAVMRVLYGCGCKVVLVSGRENKYRPQTEEWLKRYNINYVDLFMRQTSDNRKDSIVKREIYDKEIKEIKDKYNVFFVLDDRDQVVKMWRELGLTCFQVAEGNF